MTDNPTARAIGTALIVSEDAVATRQIAEAMQELALSVEVCNKVSDAMDRVNHSKLEVAVIDFSLGDKATLILQQLRGSPSNRTAVTFAITGNNAETAYALKAGSSFALERPLTFDSIRHTLQAAYGLIVRERRRYFRYPISVPAAARGKGESEVFGKTRTDCDPMISRATNPPVLIDLRKWEPILEFHCARNLCPNKSKPGTIWRNPYGELIEKLWTRRMSALIILDSGSRSRKGVEVQVLSSAP